jgi:hypothetical protein
MTSKQWTLVALAVILGGVSLYLNKDWFSRDNIQIYHRSSPRPQLFRRAQPSSMPSLPINFGFSHSLELKNLKVLVVAEAATNKYPRPIWHLTSESHSVATKTFLYGMNIRGMRRPPGPEPSYQTLRAALRLRFVLKEQLRKGVLRVCCNHGLAADCRVVYRGGDGVDLCGLEAAPP